MLMVTWGRATNASMNVYHDDDDDASSMDLPLVDLEECPFDFPSNDLSFLVCSFTAICLVSMQLHFLLLFTPFQIPTCHLQLVERENIKTNLSRWSKSVTPTVTNEATCEKRSMCDKENGSVTSELGTANPNPQFLTREGKGYLVGIGRTSSKMELYRLCISIKELCAN